MYDQTKILLILDLDETLIHATQKKLGSKPSFMYADYNVYLRPKLKYFFEQLNPFFSMAIWSSAHDTYVEDMVERIVPKGINLAFVWGRSKCSIKRDLDLDLHVYQKRLKKAKKLGYPIEQILIIDDTPSKSRDNYGNAVYIKPFMGDPNDDELIKLVSYLDRLKDINNVRTIEKRGWDK